jgi:hypothetical protein
MCSSERTDVAELESQLSEMETKILQKIIDAGAAAVQTGAACTPDPLNLACGIAFVKQLNELNKLESLSEQYSDLANRHARATADHLACINEMVLQTSPSAQETASTAPAPEPISGKDLPLEPRPGETPTR